jgi:Transmembrane secretion effector
VAVPVQVEAGAFAVSSSARGAIIPRIVEADLVPSANTLSFTVGNLGQVIGPLIARVLVVQTHGFAYAYGIDAVLFTAALYSALRSPCQAWRTGSWWQSGRWPSRAPPTWSARSSGR